MNVICKPMYFDDANLESKSSPDTPLLLNGVFRAAHDFVISRNSDGSVISFYSDDEWDLFPYISKATGNRKFRFNIEGMDFNNKSHQDLKEEMKFILFNCMFFTGRFSERVFTVLSLINKFEPIKTIASFVLLRQSSLYGNNSIRSFLTDHRCITYFIETTNRNAIKNLSALVSHLCSIGEKQLGFIPLTDARLLIREKDNQTPIIPPMIYFQLINKYDSLVDEFHPVMEMLKLFISKLADRSYGLQYESQKPIRKNYKHEEFNKNFSQALKEHDLYELLFIKYKVDSRAAFSCFLARLQRALQEIIALYTGMREQEVIRIEYDCLDKHILLPTIVDGNGHKVLKEKSTVEIISTTTKYTSYRDEVSWFCPPLVIRVVDIARSITDGLLTISTQDYPRKPLFFNPSVIRYVDNQKLIKSPFSMPFTFSCFKKHGGLLHVKRKLYIDFYSDLVISKVDRESLLASDSSRDFSEECFWVGATWVLTMHQFRRSLAFYGTSTGFLSLPTLSTNFKHNCSKITKYYTRGADDLSYFFGVFDPKENKYILPKQHVIRDFDFFFPISIADLLLNDIFSESRLFGKGGDYIMRIKSDLDSKQKSVNVIDDYKTNTLKKVKNGEINYRKTILGGCLNLAECKCRVLGEFTSCLSSECAIIKKDNVYKQISDITTALLSYEPNTGEYQVLKAELDALNKFKEYKMREEE